jgi:hypothetical protein
MTYTITVKDSAGNPLDAAYVAFNAQGVNLQTLATGTDGTVTVDSVSDAGLLGAGISMVVTLDGYSSFTIPSNSITGNVTVTLAKGGSTSSMVLIGGAILLGLLLFGKKL